MRTSLRPIITSITVIFLTIFVVFVILNIASIYDQTEEHRAIFASLLSSIMSLSNEVWNFARPFAQIILLLVIVDWIIGKWSATFLGSSFSVDWNVQTIIALIIVSAFGLAALSGLSSVADLKDLALVVVGFYFGTQRKSVEIDSREGKINVLEEHQNDVKNEPEQKTQ